MVDRTFLARIQAMKEANKKVSKKDKWGDIPIHRIDIEDESLIKEFESFDKAVEEEGLNPPNLIGALKNGNKYKEFYWRIT